MRSKSQWFKGGKQLVSIRKQSTGSEKCPSFPFFQSTEEWCEQEDRQVSAQQETRWPSWPGSGNQVNNRWIVGTDPRMWITGDWRKPSVNLRWRVEVWASPMYWLAIAADARQKRETWNSALKEGTWTKGSGNRPQNHNNHDECYLRSLSRRVQS